MHKSSAQQRSGFAMADDNQGCGCLSTAAAGLLLSVTVAAVGFFSYLRGSDVDVVPPTQLLFYKSGNVLSVAVRLPLVNQAADYNDVVTGAEIRLYEGGPVFESSGVVEPVFNDRDDPNESIRFCQAQRRCHYSKRMAISEAPDDLVIVPGGGATARYYAFQLYCLATVCRGFSSHTNALRTLDRRPLDIAISLKFHSDGQRRITCRTEAIDADYVLNVGWQTVECREPIVSDGSLF
jgi:hypothetical protein